MNISEAAAASGVSAKMIRHYESIGLVQKPKRTSANYRTYGDSDVHVLRFVRAARDLGFGMREIGELLDLWRDRRRPSRKVKALVTAHLRELERRIAELQAMKSTLEQLAHHCHGDERPDCPILERLEGSA
ncbi:MAG TPA: Cu(I)-responsive transcriptional regulator [Burkholderiales bacterium]|nr:Cu(I)-responsive transcriptional regulator [Burkholderiales bacterium]